MTRLPDAIARRLHPSEHRERPRHRNVAKMMARLQIKSPTLVPRKGGRVNDPTEIEDGLTIAAGLGAVAAQGPGYAFAVTVLCLRWWPDYVLGPEVAHGLTTPNEAAVNLRSAQTETGTATTAGRRAKRLKRVKTPSTGRVGSRVGTVSRLSPVELLTGYGKTERVVTVNHAGEDIPVKIARGTLVVNRHRTFRPAMLPLVLFANQALQRKMPWASMPPKVRARVEDMLATGALVQSLMDEYVNPTHCIRCMGYGEELRTKDEAGRPKAPTIEPCSVCIGQGQVARGVSRRARAVELRVSNYSAHVQPAYEAVLGLLRHLESRAARALIRVLGD